ncbi:MAG TPA: hypothetical protein VK095_06525 [Beutenbergiaceae bacterium]|nr:hypothetical protein [Beutenbergiaceae bacterium]
MTAALIGIGIAALALAAGGGYPLTVAVLHLAARGDRSSGAEQSPATAPPAQAEPDPSTALRGGTWIGILERLAITGAILVGYPAAIAVVIAVKGLGRFPELNTATGVSERFIIGTLTSALWAAAVGVAARGVLNALV